MDFSKQEYWSGLPFPTPGELPNPEIKPLSLAFPALQTDSLPLAPPEKARKALFNLFFIRKVKSESEVPQLTSMGFSRQEYWSGLPFLPPGDLPGPEIEPMSLAFPALQTDSFPLRHLGSPPTYTHSDIYINS